MSYTQEVIDSIGDYPIYWSNENVKLKITHVQSNQALAVSCVSIVSLCIYSLLGNGREITRMGI